MARGKREQSTGRLALAALALAGMATGAARATAPKVSAAKPAALDFERDVRPILSKHCFHCHGADDKGRMAGLRLDVRTAAIAALPNGHHAVVPGKPQQSELIRRIAATGAGVMPPVSAQSPLTLPEKGVLQRWVVEGAVYRDHWSFLPPKLPALPRVNNASWCRNPIDRFVLARLEAAGLAPSPEADRFTLLRRVSLDLRGLPPSPAEVEEFAHDTRPDAYERMVDRFLADPAYGERWARMWLDLARYADSAGYGSDPLRTIWRYRDWVVDAFNRDEPYDQFSIDQLAGDMLPNATMEQRIATAFHRNTMTNTEGGTVREEFRVAAVKDRVDTTFQVWMGLTMGCAKCHTHKYDPITQKEYYQAFAIFNQSADNDQPNEAPTVPVHWEPIEARVHELDAKIAALKAQLPTAGDKTKAIQDEIAGLERAKPLLPSVPVMQELPANQHRETHLLIKNNYLDPGEKVEAGLPHAFAGAAGNQPVDRLGLARWLFDPHNPLTARVAVNRFWAQIFGAGIVETEEDFGTQGDLPSHPKLLDWLACSFGAGADGVDSGFKIQSSLGGQGTRGSQRSGEAPLKAAGLRDTHTSPLLRSTTSPAPRLNWSMKQLLRLIVTSSTYRQSARVSPLARAKDPRNRLLSRGPHYRLEAEMVRDEALSLAGLLSRKMHGPSVFPPQPAGLWQAAFNGQRTWATSTGEDRYRRGLYTFWRRTVPYPSMATFDAPSREFCVVRRARTNTPLQAFVTLNDPVYVEAAQALARRILKEGGNTPEERTRFALRLCLGKPSAWSPSVEQTRQLVDLAAAETEHYRAHKDEATQLATDPLGPLPAGVAPEEAAAWTVVANVLLNLDAVLTKS